MSFYGWKPYVPVAKRRAAAARAMDKLRKKGLVVQPVVIEGRGIARTFWGKGWCDHMESFNDFENRLPRGRTYVRNGSVCHLAIEPGAIFAIVSGSKLYHVEITVKPLPIHKWAVVKSACAGRIGSLLDLLRGRLASGVMEVVCHRQNGLFPLPGEIKFNCDCPDWASMCKHVAAVLYGVGARLDQTPEQLFRLRNVDHEELVDVPAAVQEATKTKTSRRRIAPAGLADVFGIDLVPADVPSAAPSPEKAAEPMTEEKPRPRGKRTAATKAVYASPAQGEAKPTSTGPAKPHVAKPDSLTRRHEPARKAAVERVKKTTKTATKDARSAAAPAKPTFPNRFTGTEFRNWRESAGLTQKALGERLGVSSTTISQWERKDSQVLRLREKVLAALQEIWTH